MRIAQKLTVNVVVILFLTGVVGLVGISRLQASAEALEELSGIWLLNARYSGAMRADILDFRNRETQLLVAKNAAEIDETVGRMSKSLAAVEKSDAEYQKLVRTDEERALYGKYKAAMADFLASHKEYEALVRAGKRDEAAEYFATKGRKVFRTLIPAIEDLVAHSVEGGEKASRAAREAASAASAWMIAIVVIAVALGAVLGLWLYRSILGPLQRIRDTVTAIERDADFTRAIDLPAGDEVGETAQSVSKLLASVRGALQEMLRDAEELARDSTQLAAAARQVAAGSDSQAESAAAMAATVEQLTASINQVADNAA
ncbi:MAG TPA: methyl-accepting chemotaxis protein, partial [Rhodocyclaceae bacterium]|nr:methyl-accepting chemotaxis protein [Rhodocyclaceae bacterium]